MKRMKKKPVASAKGNLNKGKLGHKIPNMRSIILQRMNELQMTAYRLAKLTGITDPTVRNFLDGTHEMRSDKLSKILDVLGLEVRVRR